MNSLPVEELPSLPATTVPATSATPERAPVKLVFVVTVALSTVFFRKLTTYLRTRGYEVHVVSSPGPELAALAAEGAFIHALQMEREISPLRDIVSLVRLYRLLRRIAPDIANVGTPKAGLLAGLAAFLARVPVRIYTIHGLRLETANGWKRRILMIAERVACASAHRVRCVSFSLRERVAALGIAPTSKMFVVGGGTSNGIDEGMFCPTSERRIRACELRKALGIPLEAYVIGFVGRLTRDKGIHELYEAFLRIENKFTDAYLLLIGDFEDGDPVDNRVRAGIIAHPRIKLTGRIQNVCDYYQMMDVLCLPTYREGFPNVVLEAQASCIPVVTTDATGARDSVVNGTTGFVVPVGDSASLADAFHKLLADPELRAEMGRTGREWVKKNFQPHTIWEAQLALYNRLLHYVPYHQRGWRRFIKMSFDRIFAALLLLCFSPHHARCCDHSISHIGPTNLFPATAAGSRRRALHNYQVSHYVRSR